MTTGSLYRRMSLACLGMLVSLAAMADPSRPRQDELLNLLKQDCGSCHGATLTGGLGPALTPDRMKPLPVETISRIIMDGRHGTPMPGWRMELKEEETKWLARQLKKGVLP